MARQRIGSVDWRATYKDGRFQGFYYCIGYCPNCQQKQIIDESGIEEFNKRGSFSEKMKTSRSRIFHKLFHLLKNMFKLRIRLEIKENKPTEAEGKREIEKNSIDSGARMGVQWR